MSYSAKQKRAARVRRHLRVRKKVRGDASRPRLAVFRSNRHISAQVIDDRSGRTLASASTTEASLRDGSGNLAAAGKVGQLVAVFGSSLDRLAEQHNSCSCGVPADVHARRDEAGQGDRAIGHHLRRPLHAVRILRRHPGDLVDGDVERAHPVLPPPLDRLVRLEHRHVEPLGSAAPTRDGGRK